MFHHQLIKTNLGSPKPKTINKYPSVISIS